MLYCLSLRVYVGTKKGVYSDKLLRLWIESKGQKDIPIDAVTEWKRPTLPIVGTPATRSSHASNEKLARQQHEARTPARKRSRKTEWEAEKKAEQARQMFLFSCFTGLAIADMERLKFSHIQTAADGRRYIRKERQKTKVESVVPLHPIAEEILNRCQEGQAVKEEGDALVFPRGCSRSVMNSKLSTVGLACGIRQRLSLHMARHTFGTLSLSAGIPIESIAKMMGHASISSTQIYAQVTDKKISEDMDKLIQKQQVASA